MLILVFFFFFFAPCICCFKYDRQVAYYTGPTGVYELTSALYQFLLKVCDNFNKLTNCRGTIDYHVTDAFYIFF